MSRRHAFTLTELLVCIAILAVLAALLLPALGSVQLTIHRGVCAHSLHQLGAAGAAYRAESDGHFWKYREDMTDGTAWWFGLEPTASFGQREGERYLDLTRGPLGPYVIAAGGVKTDPAFMKFQPRHKPKFRNGNFGYGYNALLGGGSSGLRPVARASQFTRPAEVVVFATCAQVNTFQRPATAKNPMIEEFYLLDERERTVHFRFGGKALAAMLDGSVRDLAADPATLDPRMPEAQIGRFAPAGSKRYLTDPPGEQPAW